LELRSRLADLRAEGERLDGAHQGAVASLGSAEAARDRAESSLQALTATGIPLERRVEEAKDAVLEALGEEVRLRNLVEALGHRRGELEGRRRKLDEEQRLLGERLHANARAVDAVRDALERTHEERARVTAERQEMSRALETLAAEEAAEAAALDRARADHTQLASRAGSLRELQARYEGCTRGVASLLGRDGEPAALLASVLRVPPALERAVAAALGSRLGEVVVADTGSAIQAVRWLSESGGGRAAVIPRDPERRATVIVPAGRRLLDQIEVDPSHWALAEAVLGQVLLAADLDEALRLWREASSTTTVVTVAGEVLDPVGAVAGGSEAPLEETLLARARELRELEDALADSERRVAAQAEVLGAARARQSETRRAAMAADERLQALRLDELSAEKDRERLEEERARVAAELEAGALEASGLAGADGQVVEELQSLVDRQRRAESTVAAQRTELAEHQASHARWREELAAIEGARTEAAVAVAAAAERSRATQAELARCRGTIAEVGQRLETIEQQGGEARSGAAAASAEAARAAAARETAEVRVAELTAERDRLRVAIAEADATLTADDRAQRGAHEQLETLRSEHARLDVGLAERRVGLENLVAQLAERYGLGPEALDEVTIEEDDAQDDRAARAERLRARLAQLGDVNPGAVAELEEVRGRHEFLVAQRGDLERSLDDLRRTINQLARTSRQRFDDTFTAVNAKLEEVFPKLFPNGKARLELTPPEEGGEAGVEIVVQPAGKKLQALSLLSGGEKALTATALVLSLFLIRPTPFCLLDEVDAPLDEANIGRFNQIVRAMAETSQFVLITHNRRTMEVADTLYGITMERPGVSKVVSVRLHEAA